MDIEKRKQELCLSCLECCRTLAIPFDHYSLDEDDIKFYKMRGVELLTITQGPYLLVPSVCPHLTENGCDIYKDRPKICKDYDGREVPFMKYKCKWRELKEG